MVEIYRRIDDRFNDFLPDSEIAESITKHLTADTETSTTIAVANPSAIHAWYRL